jgi:hypothetical protein
MSLGDLPNLNQRNKEAGYRDRYLDPPNNRLIGDSMG